MGKDDFWFLCLLVIVAPTFSDIERVVGQIICTLFLAGYWFKNREEKNK